MLRGMAPRAFLLPYFDAERDEAMLFVAVGVLAVVAAAWLWRGLPRWRGAALPLVAIALIQLVVGGTVWLRTDAQVAALAARYDSDRSGFQREEVARMAAVNRNFRVYKAIEIALLAVAVALVVASRRRAGISDDRRDFWRAFGAGLALQAALMLTLDLFAEARGGAYAARIESLWRAAPRGRRTAAAAARSRTPAAVPAARACVRATAADAAGCGQGGRSRASSDRARRRTDRRC